MSVKPSLSVHLQEDLAQYVDTWDFQSNSTMVPLGIIFNELNADVTDQIFAKHLEARHTFWYSQLHRSDVVKEYQELHSQYKNYLSILDKTRVITSKYLKTEEYDQSELIPGMGVNKIADLVLQSTKIKTYLQETCFPVLQKFQNSIQTDKKMKQY